MPSQTIQWFPGHMAKTRRMISENLSLVDAVIELRDARIPASSKNPEIERLTNQKPRLILLNKSSLADSSQSRAWITSLEASNTSCILTDCTSGAGLDNICPSLSRLCAETLNRYKEKGMAGRHIRVMVLGIPNVGKSSLINRLAGSRKARVEDKPGVTRDKQWVTTRYNIDLLDMPGVLWPRFDEKTVAENLALTGAIRDEILDLTELSLALIDRLKNYYPGLLEARYKLDPLTISTESDNYNVFEIIARKRGYILRGAEIDTERTAVMLLDEFRGAKIGRITLDRAVAKYAD